MAANILNAVPIPDSPTEETSLPTLETVKRAREKDSSRHQSPSEPLPDPSSSSNAPSPTHSTPSSTLSETEEEASAQGAFNEETGEINWDCPCLGGMAHGPCGEEFRAAFSCFVYSKEEPKGMECIDRFKGMQDCFREHPDIYGAELEGGQVEEEIQAADLPEQGIAGAAVANDSTEPAQSERAGRQGGLEKVENGVEAVRDGVVATATAVKEKVEDRLDTLKNDIPTEAKPMSARLQDGAESVKEDTRSAADTAKERVEEGVETVKKGTIERAQAAKEQVATDHGEPLSESDDLLPKATHDAR